MYVAVKGGERAIEAAHRLLADRRRGRRDVPPIDTAQIEEQLSLGVARVMAEASLYSPSLAAHALKQARGDTIEAVFLLRARRTTMPRLGHSRPLDTSRLRVERRVSATYKDLPGGQVLGPTFDYTHRLMDAALAGDGDGAPEPPHRAPDDGGPSARVTELLRGEGLVETADGRERAVDARDARDAARGGAREGDDADDDPPGDLTRRPLDFPCERDVRLQALARGDEGFLLALAYSTQRGYGRTHPFVGEIRIGLVELEIEIPELGLCVAIGEIRITECQMINQFAGSATRAPAFTRGYGLVFGQAERKAMAMSLVDRSLRARELGEDVVAPAQDEEFVVRHCDNVQASGFVEHLKLPHHVDFQAELELLRRLRAEFETRVGDAPRSAEADGKDGEDVA